MARKLLTFFSAFTVMALCAVAQRTVTGTISDGESGEGLPGATVLIKGATQGAVTDAQGQYRIDLPDNDGVLVFSFVGYESQEVSVGNRSVIDVDLSPDTQTLEELVVVGYGTQQRAKVTGAITTVKSTDLTATPVYNAAQALQGRASGVTVINSGAPGTQPTVRIRGLGTINDNNPLYVIDGMIGVDINSINVNDIESMEVLKDAAASAIYGSRASNGVIIITTKKGQSGPARVTFDSYVGWQSASNRFDVLNTDQYVDYTNELQTNAGLETIQRFDDPSWSQLQNNNTDWQDEIFQTGMIQNYNIGASGGSENAVYNVSFGYQDQEGIFIQTGFERYAFRVNTEFKNKGFFIGENFNLGKTQFLQERQSGGRSLIEHAIKSAPYLPVFDDNNLGGYAGPLTIDNNDAENPVRAANVTSDFTDRWTINGTIYAGYEILDGLKYQFTFGLNYNNSIGRQFTPPFESGIHNSDRANISQNRSEFTSTLIRNSISYSTTIAGDHDIDAVVVSELQENTFTRLQASSQNLVSGQIQEITTTDALTASSFKNENNLISYLGRVSYSYKDKYLATGSIRSDGSSRFAKDERWGTFFSASAGWRISEEVFLASMPAISNLKLRASYGEVGNQNIGDYRYTSTIATNYQYRLNDTNVGGASINDLPNSALTWETTTMLNIGVDFGLFNDALYGSIEYYDNETANMLFRQPIPASLGYLSNPFVNQGTVETTGFDITLGYRGTTGFGLNWDVTANVSTTSNEITDLGEEDADIFVAGFEGDNLAIYRVGEPIGSFFGWKTQGIFQTQEEVDNNASQSNAAPGDIRFADIAGPEDDNGNPTGPDGEITGADRTIIGNYFPDVIYSVNINLDWKGFDFNLFLNGVSGNQIYNTNIFDLEGMTRAFNSGTAVLDRWTGPGTSNDVPRAIAGDPAGNARASDRYVEDGSFLRFRNMTLGYTIPTDNLLNGEIDNLRVYVTGQNLITITDYSGLDPEIGIYRDNGNTDQERTGRVGIDLGNYPQPKIFLIGLQLGF